MKRKLFLLGSLALLVVSGIFWSCQKEEVLIAEDAMLKKAKVTVLEVSPFSAEYTCAGEDLIVTLIGTGNRQIQQEIGGEWINVGQEPQGDEPIVYTIEEAAVGTYSFRYKVGSGGFTEADPIVIESCDDCEESFSYVDNQNGTYTFKYIPEENMTGAEVVFTFAQGVVITGLDDWSSNGVTKQKTMDFDACEMYTWTVTLTSDCNGQGQQTVNAWTDFNVNSESKKGELKNIVLLCN